MAERLSDAKPAASDISFLNGEFHGPSRFFPTLPFATRILETSIDFTPREKESLLLISSGWENEEIAEALRISWQSVRNINKGLFSKLEVDSRTEAAIMALTDRLVDASELKTVYVDQINCLEEDALTVRKTEILKLIARGFSNKEIAGELNISKSTVKIHITTILRKLKARNRTEAAMAYLLNDLPGENE